MAFIETNHTEVVIRKLKSDLDALMKFVRIATMVGFSAWYIYLIATNLHSIPHLMAYIILFAIVIFTFVSERTLKPKGDDNRKSKRKKVEKRRNIGRTTKIIKYLAKCVTIGLALYASITKPTSKWDLILDIASAVMLLVSVLCEFVTGYIKKYVDYISISVHMDFEQSDAVELYKKVAKFFGDKQEQLNAINNNLMSASGESSYTEQEQRIRDMLGEEANTLKAQKAEHKKQRAQQIDEQLAAAKAQQKQIKTAQAEEKKAEKKRLAEEKKQAKRAKAEAKRAEKKRLAEEKKLAKKNKKPE